MQEYDLSSKGRSHEEKLLFKLPLLKIWAGPPPLIWTKSKRTAGFPCETAHKVLFSNCILRLNDKGEG